MGGSSDIGRAVGVTLAALGHEVVLWGRDAEKLAAAAAACSGRAEHVDVTDEAQVRDGLARAGELDVVVWAAGVFDWGAAHEAEAGRWARLLDVNLTAAAVLTALALPTLVRRAPSALVYIGSGAARRAYR